MPLRMLPRTFVLFLTVLMTAMVLGLPAPSSALANPQSIAPAGPPEAPHLPATVAPSPVQEAQAEAEPPAQPAPAAAGTPTAAPVGDGNTGTQATPPGSASETAQSSSTAGTVAPGQAPVLTDTQRGEIRNLLNTLHDETSRAAFLRNLETLISVGEVAPVHKESDWLEEATTALGHFSGLIISLVSEIRNLPEQTWLLLTSLADPMLLENVSWTVLMLGTVICAALLAEWVVLWLLSRPRRAVEGHQGSHLVARILAMVLRTLLDVAPIVAFYVVAFGVLAAIQLPFVVRLAAVTIIHANVLDRIIIAAGRTLLSPTAPRLRLLPMANESATYCFLWVRRFTHTVIYGYFLLRAAWMLGLSTPAHAILIDLLAFIICGMMIIFVLQVQRPVARRLRSIGELSGRVNKLRNRIAEFWHLFAIVYIIAVYVVWMLKVDGGILFIVRATVLSLITVLVARLLVFGLHRIFSSIFRLNDEVRTQFPQLEVRANRYLPVLRQGVNALVAVVTALVVMEIWGIGPFEWMATPEGQGMLGHVLAIAIMVLGSFILWEAGEAFATNLCERHQDSTRMMTLLPFFQNGFRIILITLSSLIILSEMGVDIAPLLAGAGVLGLAVGFGAQTMVKDVITGVFILMEDTLAVGDMVELGEHMGFVEKISVRTVHLRDIDGNVHSLPFGEVQTIKNMSKQFAYAVTDVAISMRENADNAMAVMEETAREMAADPAFSASITAPYEMFGVDGIRDSAVWLRGRFKTVPLTQWMIRREFTRRIKIAFETHGIQLAFPHQTIFFGVDKQGFAEPLHVVQERARPLNEHKIPPASPENAEEQSVEPEDVSQEENPKRH